MTEILQELIGSLIFFLLPAFLLFLWSEYLEEQKRYRRIINKQKKTIDKLIDELSHKGL